MFDKLVETDRVGDMSTMYIHMNVDNDDTHI
jgi:hypothetical protein